MVQERGKTHRMLWAAIREAQAGEHVVIVGASWEHARTLRNHMERVMARGGLDEQARAEVVRRHIAFRIGEGTIEFVSGCSPVGLRGQSSGSRLHIDHACWDLMPIDDQRALMQESWRFEPVEEEVRRAD